MLDQVLSGFEKRDNPNESLQAAGYSQYYYIKQSLKETTNTAKKAMQLSKQADIIEKEDFEALYRNCIPTITRNEK